MASGDDAGSEGLGSAVEELIDEGVLAGQDQGQIGFGVLIELGEVWSSVRTSRRSREASSMIRTALIFLPSRGADFLG